MIKLRESDIRRVIRTCLLESQFQEADTMLKAAGSLGGGVGPAGTDYARDTGKSDGSGEGEAPVGKVVKDKKVEDSGGHKIIRFGDSKNVTLVYFYPGIGYGTQPFVSKQISNIAGRDGMVVILANNNMSDFSKLQAAGDKYVKDNDLNVAAKRLGGWSGGSIGVTQAISKSDFSKIILADPTPNGENKSSYPLHGISNYKVTKLLYNPSTWKSLDLDDDQVKLAKKMKQAKDPATGTGGDHNKILMQGLKYILT